MSSSHYVFIFYSLGVRVFYVSFFLLIFRNRAVSSGKVLHSHDYRYPEPFSGQSVVVLGAKASGLDISIELANGGAQVRVCQRKMLLYIWNMLLHRSLSLSPPLPPPPLSLLQVFLSHRQARLTFPLPSRIQQADVVTAVGEDGSVLFQVRIPQAR